MTKNPSEIIAKSPMGRFQIFAVAICVLLNAVDGFDVLSISFASPGIAADWGINRAALGVVLSLELIGMAFGSIFLGRYADSLGRRPLIIICLLLMAFGMMCTAFAGNIYTLSAFRLITGLGIGGMLAATNAMVAEYANEKSRHLCVTIMAAGFPLGAIVGGYIASHLLQIYSWHSVFLLGAGMTLALLPIVFFMLPESISFLTEKRPAGALEKINKTLRRMGHETVDKLPAIPAEAPKVGWAGLFSGRWARLMILLTVAYFAHIMTFYYILKWIPKIVVDMGSTPSLAGNVLVWANVGGATGSILLGLSTRKFDVRGLVILALIMSLIMLGVFGRGYETLSSLAMVSAFVGLCTNAGVVGLYALMASRLPTELRASGTGFIIGMGRGGAASGPIIAGVLFQTGASLMTVSIIMGLGSAVAAIAIFLLPSGKDTTAT